MRVVCNGAQIMTGAEGQALCLDEVGAPVAWTIVPDVPEIDLETVGAPFSAGFGLVLLFWALGKSVSIVIDVVRR